MSSPPDTVDYVAMAQSYVDRHPALPPVSIRRLGRLRLNLDEWYCREVADLFEAAPVLAWSAGLADDYELFKRENLAQYSVIRREGVDVRPWPHSSQPYRGSRDLVRRVRRTGILHVFLTAAGHGPDAGPGARTAFHPLRESAGVVEHGVELTHNDIFRVVHDIFGHVVHGNGFGPRGEFLATRCHLAMYAERAHRVLLTEQLGQICWFFYGPHLRVGDRLPAPGEPGHLDPARRPYARQKVFPFPRGHADTFKHLFEEEPHDAHR